MAKCTRSVSTHNSTRLVKNPRCSLTTVLVKELSSPQRALEVIGAVAEVLVVVAVAHEVASDVPTPMVATREIVFKVAPAIFEPEVATMTGMDTGAIASPPVMMPRMATPPHILTTRLVSSHEFFAHIFLHVSGLVFM